MNTDKIINGEKIDQISNLAILVIKAQEKGMEINDYLKQHFQPAKSKIILDRLKEHKDAVIERTEAVYGSMIKMIENAKASGKPTTVFLAEILDNKYDFKGQTETHHDLTTAINKNEQYSRLATLMTEQSNFVLSLKEREKVARGAIKEFASDTEDYFYARMKNPAKSNRFLIKQNNSRFRAKFHMSFLKPDVVKTLQSEMDNKITQVQSRIAAAQAAEKARPAKRKNAFKR